MRQFTLRLNEAADRAMASVKKLTNENTDNKAINSAITMYAVKEDRIRKLESEKQQLINELSRLQGIVEAYQQRLASLNEYKMPDTVADLIKPKNIGYGYSRHFNYEEEE